MSSQAPPDEHPCSGCPFLDLGHRYPVGDVRDPWRRMPELFAAAQLIFGRPFYNHTSKSRQHGEKLLRHYCRVQRSKYGACTRKRSLICREIVLEALTFAATADGTGNRIARAWSSIRRAVNSEESHARLVPTIVQRGDVLLDQEEEGDVREYAIPVVRFKQVPLA